MGRPSSTGPGLFIGMGGYIRDFPWPDKTQPRGLHSTNDEASLHAGARSISLCILIAVGFGFRGLDEAGHVACILITPAAQ